MAKKKEKPLNFKDWNVWQWLKGVIPVTTIDSLKKGLKECVKYVVAGIFSLLMTKYPVYAGVLTIVSKSVLDIVDYWINK